MDQLSVRLGFYITCASLVLVFSSLLSCGRVPPPTTNNKSVELDQTAVENQYSIGFCWAYATIGLIESNYKMRTGKTINLSEEALGYARMKEELFLQAKAYREGRISLDRALMVTQGDGLEGWFVRIDNSDPRRDAMELIDDYGVVPEDSWKFKFDTVDKVEQLKLSLQAPFESLLTNGTNITRESIDTVLTAPGAFPSVPPRNLRFEGTMMTSRDFAKSTLMFSSQDYVAIYASNATEAASVVQVMKRAMAAGHSVPMSFAVSFRDLKNGLFSAPNYPASVLDGDSSLPRKILEVNGGHAVLATDFVNHGGREGAIPPEDLSAEVEKSAEQLAYIKFKNSWGVRGSTNERGISISSSTDGYYRMNLGYIKTTAALRHFGIVVLRSFAR